MSKCRSSVFFLVFVFLSSSSAFEEEEGIEEDDGDEFAAMQTHVTLLGRVGGAERLEEDSDSASFIQSQVETISRTTRSCESGLEVFDEIDDAVSLIQTDAVKHSAADARETYDDDKSSLIQADIVAADRYKAAAEKLKSVDRSKILAWDTILAMDVNTEKDEVQKMGKTLQKETSVARSLTNEISDLNMLLVEPDEAPANAAAPHQKCEHCDESTSLLQEDLRIEKSAKHEAKKSKRSKKRASSLIGDETSFMQTTITLSKGSRRVGRPAPAPDDADEEDLSPEDGIALMQESVKVEHGCSRTNRYMDYEEDEDDVFSL